MTDCTNETMRDRLPELANGLLTAAEAEAVRAHAAGCASCAAELAMVETTRLVLRASAPKVDLAAITRAVATPRPVLTVERGGATAPSVPRRSAWRSRQWVAAAATVLVAVSLSIPLLKGPKTEPTGTPIPDTTVAVAPANPTPAPSPLTGGLVVGDGLNDLSTDELSTLLGELDKVEATITAEPSAIVKQVVDNPEGI